MLLHSYPSLSENIETDILIVGGGITGALLAHQCIKDGYNTTLIDRREIANGSTSATTSMLQYEIDVPLYKLVDQVGEAGAVASYKACAKAIDQLGAVAGEINSGSGFTKKESLYYAEKKNAIKWLQQECSARRKYGFEVQWLEAAEITERYGLDENFGGILSAQGGSIDAFHFTHDVIAFNHAKGLRVFDKTALAKVAYHQDGVVIETEYGNTIRAKKLIYCNGFESTEIIPERFVNLHSTWAIITEPLTEPIDKIRQTLFWNSASPYLYMRTTNDNRLLIGGLDEKFKNTKARDALLVPKGEKLLALANQLFPQLNLRLDFSWAGTFGETSDGLPYIGSHPKFPSTYFVLGFGGNGITFSVTGMEMISQLLQGATPALAEWFRFGR